MIKNHTFLATVVLFLSIGGNTFTMHRKRSNLKWKKDSSGGITLQKKAFKNSWKKVFKERSQRRKLLLLQQMLEYSRREKKQNI